ncbi:MAG: hypothetical protein RLY58_269 [Pseudomonadota bacterium]|jgi:hypothetical protein
MGSRFVFMLCVVSYGINVYALQHLTWSAWMIPVGLLAWYVADAQSGLVHMYMDYRPCTPHVGLKEIFFYQGSRESAEYLAMRKAAMRRISFFERVVYDFKNHHPRPNALGRRNFEQQTVSIAFFVLPFSIVLNLSNHYYPLPDLWLMASVVFLGGSMLTQYFHGTLHREQNPWWVLGLRRTKLLMTPQAHDVHHATLACDFATISGWSNPLLNRVFLFYRRRGGFDRAGLEPE